MKNFSEFKKVALYCEETYGIQNDLEEKYFICPECGEPILYEDWHDLENFWYCPICEINLKTGEYDEE